MTTNILCHCKHPQAWHSHGVAHCVGDMGKCPCQAFKEGPKGGRFMFHLKQDGRMKDRDFMIWSHGISLPSLLNNFLAEVQRFKDMGWVSTHAATVAIHSDRPVEAEEAGVLEFIAKYVVSPEKMEVEGK